MAGRVSPSWLLSLLLPLACAGAPRVSAPERASTTEPVATTTAAVATPLERDPAVRTGRLDNGLTYYVRKHAHPAHRVSMWLTVDAGSVLEDDDQLGLAHFVEHMAFNGTTRFPEHALLDFLEHAGMELGADTNATTSMDETLYQLKLPSDDPKLVAKGFDVLVDWASAMSFDGKQIDLERGVVVEEWRAWRGAWMRLDELQRKLIYPGSKYAVREPGGTKEVLETAPHAALTRFYRDWYRPELMAVVVVGDVDPAAIETEIRSRFAGLKNPEQPRPRPTEAVPIVPQTRVAVFRDDELPSTLVQVQTKRPRTPLRTDAQWRERLVESLFTQMLTARLAEQARKPDAAVIDGISMANRELRQVDMLSLMAEVKTGTATAGLRTLLQELERVRRHGFVATELARTRDEVLRLFELQAAEVDKVEAEQHAEAIAMHHLGGDALPGAAAELALARRYLPSIELDELRAVARRWSALEDRVVLASGPGDALPKEAELRAVIDGITNAEIAPYVDTAAGAKLLAEAPEPGTIASTRRIDDLGVTVWQLDNGAKVVLKPTDFKNDEILMIALSPGGHSLAADERFQGARVAAEIVERSGVGNHDATTLEKLLAGKMVVVSPYLEELEEGITAWAAPRDLETMLQLVHLYFAAPRRDELAFRSWRAQKHDEVANRDLDPEQAFFAEYQAFVHGGHPRWQPLRGEQLGEIDHDDALEFYRERFADAGDFTFVLVGNLDVATVEPLVRTYLGSLPGGGKPERWRDRGARAPRNGKTMRIHKGREPKSMVALSFNGPARWSAQSADDLALVNEVLQMRLFEVLREEMSGIYTASAWGELLRRPRAGYRQIIQFGCAPENVERLDRATFDVIAELRAHGVDDDTVAKLRELRRRRLETNLRSNEFWLEELTEHERYGTDPRAILDKTKLVERPTSATVRAAVQRYLDPKRHITAVLMPAADAK